VIYLHIWNNYSYFEPNINKYWAQFKSMKHLLCQYFSIAVFLATFVATTGSHTDAVEPPLISAELKAITADWYTLPNKEWAKIDSVFLKGLQNPYIKLMYNQMLKATIGKPSKPFKIRIRTFPAEKDPNKSESLGKYRDEYFFDNNGDTKINGILLNKKLFTDLAYKKMLMVTFFAKFINAYQQTVYRSEYKTLKANINLETEQRFFIEFIEHMSRTKKGETLFELSNGYSFYGSPKDQQKLVHWLDEIKKTPNHTPTLENTKQKYFEFFIPRFQTVWKETGYGSLPTAPDEALYAVLLLFV